MSINFLIIALQLFAATIDRPLPQQEGWHEKLVIIDSTATPLIPVPWLVQNTLIIYCQEDTLIPDRDYLWIDSTRSVLLLPGSNLQIGDTLSIIYQSAKILTESEFFMYQPLDKSDLSGFTSEDSLSSLKLKRRKSPARNIDPLDSWGNLHRRGTLTRGVRFGESEGSLSSGLHLELSGQPTPGVTVDAVLDDRNIPAAPEGGSATLSELDRILLRVKTSSIEAELGDWDLNWNSGRYGRVQRQLKGGRVATKHSFLSTETAIAGGSNVYHSIVLTGTSGNQGPYELTDKFGNPGVIVAAGSEKVYLNGAVQNRGRNADYTIDYQNGTVTFTPQVAVRSDSRIEVEYEYGDGSYPRYFYGERVASQPSGADGFSIEAATLIEGRNGEKPLSFDWNDDWRDVVSASGDNPSLAVVSGIDSVGTGSGDYVYDLFNDMQILRFAQPDTLGIPRGYLNVEFIRDEAGAYRKVYDGSLQIYYFKWVGQGEGGWSPVRRVPLPDKLTHADIRSAYSVAGLHIDGELAISDYDRNTLSAVDDSDNKASAYSIRTAYGEKGYSGVFLAARFRNREQDYTSPQRDDEPDFRFRWNLSDSVAGRETVWEAETEFAPLKALRLSGSAGWLKLGQILKSQRLNVSGTGDLPVMTINAGVDKVESKHKGIGRTVRTIFNSGVNGKTGFIRPGYSYNAQSQRLTAENDSVSGSDIYDHDVSISTNITKSNSARFIFAYRSEDQIIRQAEAHLLDTRSFTVNWESRLRSMGGLTASVQRNYTTFTDPFLKPQYSSSARIEPYYRPYGSPWSVRADYSLNTGNERTGATIASYVGEGRGDYRREGDRYVPDPDGDFILREVLTDTLKRISKVNLDMRLSWRKPSGREKGDKEPTGTFGLTGASTRFDAGITTGKDDPLTAFLLASKEFSSDQTLQSRLNILQDFDFLEGNPRGDGRISLRWNQDRDRTRSGGEQSSLGSVSVRIIRRISPALRGRVEPKFEKSLRRGIAFNETRSEVVSTGGAMEVTHKRESSPVESGLEFGYEEREDKLHKRLLIERIWTPRLSYAIRNSGTVKVEGQWRRLSSAVASAGYDLDRGWSVGDNFIIKVNVDYRLHNHLTLSAYYNGRWRGKRVPRHQGLIELTATL